MQLLSNLLIDKSRKKNNVMISIQNIILPKYCPVISSVKILFKRQKSKQNNICWQRIKHSVWGLSEGNSLKWIITSSSSEPNKSTSSSSSAAGLAGHTAMATPEKSAFLLGNWARSLSENDLMWLYHLSTLGVLACGAWIAEKVSTSALDGS